MNISYTLMFTPQRSPFLSALPPLPPLPRVLLYSSSVPRPALTCLSAPPCPPSSIACCPPFSPPTTHTLLAQLPKQPLGLQKTAAHSEGFGVGWGEESGAGSGKGEGRRGGAGFSFPLNCPTWLSVLSLNKHSHFLLTAHIGTQTQAGTHPHKHTPIGCAGMLELHHTKTSMRTYINTHTHNTLYTPAGSGQCIQSCTAASKPTAEPRLHNKTPQD